MALRIDITDDKGVTTQYHKIKSFEYDGKELTVKLASYVTKAMRDAEKAVIDQNKLALEYDTNIETLRTELDSLSSQLTPEGKGEPEVVARAVELTEEVNSLVLTTERPVYQDELEKYCAETEIKIEYFEPLTLEGIYDKIATDERYATAQKI